MSLALGFVNWRRRNSPKPSDGSKPLSPVALDELSGSFSGKLVASGRTRGNANLSALMSKAFGDANRAVQVNRRVQVVWGKVTSGLLLVWAVLWVDEVKLEFFTVFQYDILTYLSFCWYFLGNAVVYSFQSWQLQCKVSETGSCIGKSRPEDFSNCKY